MKSAEIGDPLVGNVESAAAEFLLHGECDSRREQVCWKAAWQEIFFAHSASAMTITLDIERFF